MKGMCARNFALLATIAAASSMGVCAKSYATSPVGAGQCTDINAGNFNTLKAQVQAMVCASTRGRLLIVGEIHGGRETPELVAAVLADIARSRPVRLGLEIPVSEQASLQTYLHSSGSAQDRASLLQAPFWKSSDGRSSNAMLQLIESARVLRSAGRDVDVFPMEPEYGGDQATVVRQGGFMHVKEAGMAEAIRKTLHDSNSKPFVVALMGNVHARYGGKGILAESSIGPSVTEQLASAKPYVVLPFARQTNAWNCMADGCAVHAFTTSSAPQGSLPRFVVDVSTPSGPTVVKLWLPVITASLPANPESHAAVPASPPPQH
ncbi:MAG: hypothetical protein V4566_11095 [Pseudomonadota bacterium]